MRNARRCPLLVVLGIVSLSACKQTTAPNGTIALTVQTDKSAYSLTTDHAATPFLVNRGAVAVYLPMNEYVGVQRLTNGVWSESRPWFAVDGTSISFPLQPGDTLRALPMAWGYVDNAPGTYRFLFEVAQDPNGRHILEEGERVSPAFELHR